MLISDSIEGTTAKLGNASSWANSTIDGSSVIADGQGGGEQARQSF
jgi:hypothetical protein